MKALPHGASRLEKSTYLIVGLVAIVFLVSGILLSIVWKDEIGIGYKLTYLFLSELGVAFAVALTIVFTIEHFSRTRHKKAADELMEKINKNLFDAILKRKVPDAVFKEVENCLLCGSIFRTHYEIDYNLMPIAIEEKESCEICEENFNKYLWCHIRSSYRLKNITNQQITQKIEMNIELPIDESMRSFVQITSVRINGDDLSPREIEACSSTTEAHRCFCKEVSIPPNASIFIEIGAKTAKRKVDQEVWASRLPSEGLKLRVSAPGTITVHAEANHSKSLRKGFVEPHTTIWELEHGIFPFQSVIFWWNAE